jgi:hypothetical protein
MRLGEAVEYQWESGRNDWRRRYERSNINASRQPPTKLRARRRWHTKRSRTAVLNQPRQPCLVIPVASDNTYYVTVGFASITAFASKSILTEPDHRFVAHHYSGLSLRKFLASDRRETGSPVLPFVSIRCQASGLAVHPRSQKHSSDRRVARVSPLVLWLRNRWL